MKFNEVNFEREVVTAGNEKATKQIDAATGIGMSWSFSWAGAGITGEVALQGSSQPGKWVDINGSVRPITGNSGTVLYNVRQIYFKWMRGRIKSSSGDITVDTTATLTGY